ncbi:MAG: hypothetical protein QGH85_01215 [Candidatus Pacebacteria bacterium]|jgi:hypothetical protein|nr:hypothetical protein [Candidatus Paceibacterota bacterium]MDP6387781.1 hypothetical protein [Candidatus Paceibacterota bacterium]MDP7159481.1 hypothetical protein [Candidatus Paceibacterota bacterium]MDP7365983.1 hypothetical protein [Candidatus Paceibacterota bacterium]MDP7466224.1 hypothetical protein [Candidatus Paceibacterota bacterium]|tara:strand:+ start:405 stop:671 length:267 start_codon:yes stop_codon:yes gene_type:complete
MDNLTKLQNIIKDSSLSDEDKSFWNEKLSMKLPSIVIESFIEYLEEKPDELEQFTDFLKRKFKAFESGDKEELNKILKEEEEKLNKLN